ncbi:MAG TPA: glycosyltransferase family 4 protein [Thermoanaerobaculia bacterium]|jgi:glycosyltransferase involved in cell wall biosynthesis|nr:glycosyltransferase family 4 protein [Thermoanaerobaculia bacterium]
MSESYPLPRKVLMTADTVGGVWTYAMELALGLAERGVEVALATMGGPLDEFQREKAGRIPRFKLFESTFKLEWQDDPWRDVEKAGEWLLGLEDRICPDLVHLNSYVHAALPWSVPKVVAGHSCVLSWWRAVKKESAPAEWDRYAAEVEMGLAAADLVVAPSGAMLSCLIEHYGPMPRTRVIPNGRDARQFRPGAKEPVLFSAGRLWDEAKNLEALEQVAPRLPWPVYVAGENHHPDGGEARPHHTRLLGRLSQRALSAWLSRSAIYVLPARYEPFGLSVLEAALSGCALVLGDIPSLRETWRNRAVFVPPDDPDALETALRSLIDNPDRRAALSLAARNRALELTPERMVGSYLTAYGEVLARSGAISPALEEESLFATQIAV